MVIWLAPLGVARCSSADRAAGLRAAVAARALRGGGALALAIHSSACTSSPVNSGGMTPSGSSRIRMR